jgi:hypothetical protein
MKLHNHRIYFIVSPSYHGSTLLSLLLGNHSRIVSLGDTFPTSRYDQVCGCGRRVSECHFWRNAIKQVDYSGDTGDLQVIPRFAPITPSKWMNQRYGDRIIRLLLRLKLSLPKRAENQFVKSYLIFVNYALRYYNKNIFIDGGKQISRLYTLFVASNIVKGVIHITRNPLSFVTSCVKQNGNGQPNILKYIKTYKKYHIEISNFCRQNDIPYIRIKYEDLLQSKHKVMASCFDFLEINNEDVFHPIAKDVHWHGNQSMFGFNGEIQNNEKWKTQLNKKQTEFIIKNSIKIRYELGY